MSSILLSSLRESTESIANGLVVAEGSRGLLVAGGLAGLSFALSMVESSRGYVAALGSDLNIIALIESMSFVLTLGVRVWMMI